jgi:pantoate--beta-alanine ligase
MTVFESVAAWRRERAVQQHAGHTLGVVPTMGALHEGHRSLVERSRADNDRTLVTIFVNATQFTDPRDLERYPRTLEQDLTMLRDAGADSVLVPTHDELYADHFRYRVTETEVSHTLEGAHRPGHFDGVLTVVLKLLLLASAERAYFGEKDWQQLSLVRGMAQAFFLPTMIVACPTVRAADGLALSSRNRLLSEADRTIASRLFRALTDEPTADAAVRALESAGFVVDYVAETDGRRLAAARLGGVRLIDNVPLTGVS